MITRVNKVTMLAMATLCGMQLVMPAYADSYSGYTYRRYHRPVTMHEYFQDHPMVRKATIGAGVGTAAGALTGLVTHRGVLRGAAIGAGTGAGVGVIRASRIMQRHPIMQDVATGATTGLGLGWAGGREHGTTAKATAVGAGVGLAAGLLRHGL